MNLPVELIVGGRRMRAVSQDLSALGMFVRLSPPLPVGTAVQIVLAPNGQRLVTAGRVTHALAEVEARTLGRFPGIGVAFRDPVRPADQPFTQAIVRLLVTMFEQERKSGQLALTRDQVVAWVDFIDGKIVRARSTEIDADSRTVMMSVLDWQAGYFELVAGSPAVAPPELDTTVTHLLLEHARLRDEAMH